MRMSSLTSEKTVGSMKKPFKPSALPPHSSLAPSLMPLRINSNTRFCCSRLICGGWRTERMWELRAEEKEKGNKSVVSGSGGSVVLTHLWTLLSSGIEGAADYPPLGSLHTPANKLLIYGLLHEDTRAGRAALACVEKHTLVGLFHSQIHWGGGGITIFIYWKTTAWLNWSNKNKSDYYIFLILIGIFKNKAI